VAGTDEGAIWTFTEGCIILVLCPPYWVISVFHSSKETHFCLFYQDFILSVSHVLSAARLLLSRCAYRGLWLEHAIRTTVLAMIVSIATTIGSIFDDLCPLTDTADVRRYFLNHALDYMPLTI
jgi:hypothetical protein